MCEGMLHAPFKPQVSALVWNMQQSYWQVTERRKLPNLGQDDPTFYKLAKGPGRSLFLQRLLPARQAAARVLAVLPPFPITLPAAKDGTLMWASSFTSSLGLTKFSSLIFP